MFVYEGKCFGYSDCEAVENGGSDQRSLGGVRLEVPPDRTRVYRVPIE